MMAAEGGIDAVVEGHEGFTTVTDAAMNDFVAEEDAAIYTAVDAVANSKERIGGFHKEGHLTSIDFAEAKKDCVGAYTRTILGVFGSVADMVSFDSDSAVASGLAYVVTVKKYLHNLIFMNLR